MNGIGHGGEELILILDYKEIIEKYKESENNEAKRFFGDVFTHENLKNAVVEMSNLREVYGMLFAITKSNVCIKDEDEPIVKSYPFKNIKMTKDEDGKVLYEEFGTNLQDISSPCRFGESPGYDIGIKILAKREE